MTLGERVVQLLHTAERITKTDLRYIMDSGRWYALGFVPSMLISLATAYAFANLVPKETYGSYQYVLSMADLFGIFVLSGIDSAVTRSVARGKEGSLYEALRTKIKWGMIGGVGAILFGSYYFIRGNELLGSAFVLVGLFIPFWEAPGLWGTYLQGKQQFKFLNLYDIASQCFVAILVIGALFFSKNLLVILLAYMGGLGTARLIAFLSSIRRFPPNTVRDAGLVPYGKHLTAMNAVANVSSQLDTVLLWQFLGPGAVAIYYFAQTIPVRGASVIKIINRIAFPKLASQRMEDIRETLMLKILFLCSASVCIALGYTLVAPFIFSTFFPNYAGSVIYTQVLSLLIIFQPFSLLNTSLAAQGKTKLLYFYNFALPVIRLALFLTLIPLFGLWGAVCGLISVKIADSALSTLLFFRKEIDLKKNNLEDTKCTIQ